MAESDTTQDLKLAGAAAAPRVPRKSAMRRLGGRLGQGAAGISAFALGLAVAAMAAAQSGGNFQTAPKSAATEAAEATAAAAAPDMILGIEVNTIFFIAAGVIAVFWFTLGGGRKPKVSRG